MYCEILGGNIKNFDIWVSRLDLKDEPLATVSLL